jgi:hypothetical protein
MQAHELFAAHVQYVTSDAEKWRSLWSDDAVLELPYVSSIGMQDKYVGLDAVYKFMQETIVSQSNKLPGVIAASGSTSCVPLSNQLERSTIQST